MAHRTKGVRCSFQAFCDPCNWTGAHWLGEDARRNALAEYNWHKEQKDHDSVTKPPKATRWSPMYSVGDIAKGAKQYCRNCGKTHGEHAADLTCLDQTLLGDTDGK